MLFEPRHDEVCHPSSASYNSSALALIITRCTHGLIHTALFFQRFPLFRLRLLQLDAQFLEEVCSRSIKLLVLTTESTSLTHESRIGSRVGLALGSNLGFCARVLGTYGLKLLADFSGGEIYFLFVQLLRKNKSQLSRTEK